MDAMVLYFIVDYWLVRFYERRGLSNGKKSFSQEKGEGRIA